MLTKFMLIILGVVAYLVPAQIYESLLEKLEDYELGLIIRERESEKSQAIEVFLNDL